MGLLTKFRDIVYIEETPHNLALSFAVGTLIAISPLLGLHTLMGLGACFIKRINRFVLFLGVYITNPWTIVPIYTFCTWVGALIVGTNLGSISVEWKGMSLDTIHMELGPILLPFFLGSTVVSVIAALASYFIVRAAVISARANKDDEASSGGISGGSE